MSGLLDYHFMREHLTMTTLEQLSCLHVICAAFYTYHVAEVVVKPQDILATKSKCRDTLRDELSRAIGSEVPFSVVDEFIRKGLYDGTQN